MSKQQMKLGLLYRLFDLGEAKPKTVESAPESGHHEPATKTKIAIRAEGASKKGRTASVGAPFVNPGRLVFRPSGVKGDMRRLTSRERIILERRASGDWLAISGFPQTESLINRGHMETKLDPMSGQLMCRVGQPPVLSLPVASALGQKLT